jgi:hypothetical protein
VATTGVVMTGAATTAVEGVRDPATKTYLMTTTATPIPATPIPATKVYLTMPLTGFTDNTIL